MEEVHTAAHGMCHKNTTQINRRGRKFSKMLTIENLGDGSGRVLCNIFGGPKNCFLKKCLINRELLKSLLKFPIPRPPLSSIKFLGGRNQEPVFKTHRRNQ